MNNNKIECNRSLVFAGLIAILALFSLNAIAEDTLEQRIQAIEDKLAIEQLIMGEYPLALDSRDWKAYANTFAKNGKLIQGDNVVEGRQAIEENFSRPRPPRPQSSEGEAPAQPELRVSKHVISNLKLDLQGDRAVATAYWQTVSTRGRTTTVAGAGHYNDVLIKEDGQWKFLSREIVNPLREAAASNSESNSDSE